MSRRKFLVRSAMAAGVLITAPTILFRSSQRPLKSRNGFKAIIDQGNLRKVDVSRSDKALAAFAELKQQGISVDLESVMRFGRSNYIAPAVKTDIFSSEGWVFLSRDKISGKYKSAFLEERYMDDLDAFADGYIVGMKSNGYSSNHARFILPDRIVSDSKGTINYFNGFGKNLTLRKCKGRLKVSIA